MVDIPPSDHSQKGPNDWARFVGSSPAEASNEGNQPIEDVPPPGFAEDAIRTEAVADMQATRKLREKYADKAYQLAAGCISVWTILLGAQGVVKVVMGIEMWNDKVIIAVTTGVTVSVLAAFLGVIRGLFPHTSAKTKS